MPRGTLHLLWNEDDDLGNEAGDLGVKNKNWLQSQRGGGVAQVGTLNYEAVKSPGDTGAAGGPSLPARVDL